MSFSFNRAGYAYTLGSANNLPNGDWAMGGWLQVVDNHGDMAPSIMHQGGSSVARVFFLYHEDQVPIEACRNRFSLLVRDTVGRESEIETGGTYAANPDWQHVLAQRSNNVIAIYVDGVADPVTAPAYGPVVINGTNMFGYYGACREAEWAKWDRALGAEEILALARGYSPRFFPKDRKWYFPMVRQLHELDLPLYAAQLNATVADHPRILQPHRARVVMPPLPPLPAVTPLYRVAGGDVWHTGAAAGRHDVPGARAGQTYLSGQLAGRIHG